MYNKKEFIFAKERARDLRFRESTDVNDYSVQGTETPSFRIVSSDL